MKVGIAVWKNPSNVLMKWRTKVTLKVINSFIVKDEKTIGIYR